MTKASSDDIEECYAKLHGYAKETDFRELVKKVRDKIDIHHLDRVEGRLDENSQII